MPCRLPTRSAKACRLRTSTAAVAAPPLEARNPYKGLRPFIEADAADFYGREAFVERLLHRWARSGPQGALPGGRRAVGSGKSSVVRAGLCPRSAGGDRRARSAGSSPTCSRAAPVRRAGGRAARGSRGPAARPARASWSRARAGCSRRCERVRARRDRSSCSWSTSSRSCSRSTDDEAERSSCSRPARGGRRPAQPGADRATLRADFYDRPLAYPRFGELMGRSTEVVTPLAPDELERAIVRAGRARSASRRAGAGRRGRRRRRRPARAPCRCCSTRSPSCSTGGRTGRLTLAAYREIGGVGGALAAQRRALFETLDDARPRGRPRALPAPRDARRGRARTRGAASALRARLGLETDPRRDRGGHRRLRRRRLLTFDRDPATREPTVEVAHEALLARVGRLRDWIDEAQRRHPRPERSRRPPRTGRPRASGRELPAPRRPPRARRDPGPRPPRSRASTRRDGVPAGERRSPSGRGRAAEGAAAARERALERRSIRRLRGSSQPSRSPRSSRASLTASRSTSGPRPARGPARHRPRARGAAAVATSKWTPSEPPARARGGRATRSVGRRPFCRRSEEALHRAVGASRIVLRCPRSGGALDWSPTGDVFATEGSDGSGVIDIRDVRTGRSSARSRATTSTSPDVAFSADGSMLATTGADGFLKVWDPSNGALLAEVSGIGAAQGTSFSDDGRLAAAAWSEEGVVRVVNLSTRRVVRTFGDLLGANGTSFGPGGSRIAVSAKFPATQEGARPARSYCSTWRTGVVSSTTGVPGNRSKMSPGVPTATSWPRGPTTSSRSGTRRRVSCFTAYSVTPRRSRASIGGRIRHAPCWSPALKTALRRSGGSMSRVRRDDVAPPPLG